MRRHRVRAPLKTGVRVLDLFTPLCAGQRIGIFAGSGVGKSTLLSMLTRSRGFDTVVLALVGERGREVREFLEDALLQNRARAVTVVSTGDESPMMRRLAPKTALSIAESFRDAGENVLLIVDSVTRFAHATREVALAAGEAPGRARLYAVRLQRAAEAARARRARRGGHGLDHRRLLGARRRRRPQRPHRRQHPRHPRRPHRARARHRRPGPLPRGQRADLGVAPRQRRLDAPSSAGSS